MKRVRRQLSNGSPFAWAALVAGLAAAGAATPALADNECGVAVGGQVTCTRAGNPYAGGITYTSAGNLAVTTTADAAVTNAITVTSTGGTASVASGGTVATAGANTRGIVVSGNGAVAVSAASVTTASMNSAGIVASSATGGVTVTSASVAVAAAGGAGILVSGQGAVAITSGAASAVDNAAIYAVSRGGPLTIAVTGATSAGSGSDTAIFGSSGSSNMVTVASGATVTGGTNAIVLSSETGSTVTNAGTLTGANGFAVMVNRGVATVTNSGTLTGRVNFVGNNNAAQGSSLTNSGTFNVTGFSLFAGNSTLTNSGTVQVPSTAGGNLNFIGLTSFGNSGTVSLANGRATDVLSTSGNFTGSGASALVLDARLGNNVSTADKFVVGGAATGSTTITIRNLDASAGLYSGVTVVQAGAGTSASAFQLASGSANAGFTSYNLVFNPANNSFTLYGTPSAAAYRPLRLLEGGRNISAQVEELWSAHMRSQRDASPASGPLWGGVYGARESRHDFEQTTVFGQTAVQDLSYHQDFFGAQLGLDLLRGEGPGAGTLGVTGGYTHSRQSFSGGVARARFDTASGGIYAGIRTGPLFVNLLARYDHYWIDYLDRSIGLGQHVHGHSANVAGEAGYRGDMGAFYVEPLVSASYVRTTLNDLTAFASDFDFRSTRGVLGKAGLRVGKDVKQAGGGALALYAGGNAVKELGDRDALFYGSNGATLRFAGRRVPLYGEGYAGLTIRGPGGISGFVEGVGTFGKSTALRGGGGRAGIRIGL